MEMGLIELLENVEALQLENFDIEVAQEILADIQWLMGNLISDNEVYADQFVKREVLVRT